MSHYYMGIDPGKSGGLAILDREGSVVCIHSFSTMTQADIAKTIGQLSFLYVIKRCGLEKVHSMPGQGVKSSFSFGENFGMLKGSLFSSFIPVELVTPTKWQKYLGCLTGGDKRVSKQKAQELFPKEKVTHAVADALLIAEYIRQIEHKRV